MKFIDSIKLAIAEHRHFVALEFFPPMNQVAVAGLYQRMERMASLGPILASVTWADDGSTAEETINIAENTQSLLAIDAHDGEGVHQAAISRVPR